jgi:acyl-CoA reductase-like NAD-dependent aldehyde dehydrogenase
MTTPFQIKEIEEQLEDARSKGAKILTGGMREPGVIPSLFFPPTLVVDVDEKMKIVKNETFGPVIAVSKFSTEEDAIRIANSTSYGLSSSVWSKDIEKALRVAGKLTTGSVSINNVIMTFANPDLPFGGIKESGFGRYKGCFGLHSFSNIKAVMIDPMPFSEMHWFPYKKEKYKLLSKLISALYGEDFIGLIKTIFIAARLQLIAFKNKL